MSGPFHIHPKENSLMWVNILSGAIMLTMEAWMQFGQWAWF
jgi:hypothetical protein